MRTFSIQTLGCKVNQYESEQLATLLRRHGLVAVDGPQADLRIVNTCSVTLEAASKSRQAVRRVAGSKVRGKSRVIVTGCWATSNKTDASRLAGVDAVLGHHDDVAAELDQLLLGFAGMGDEGSINQAGTPQRAPQHNRLPEPPGVKQELIGVTVRGRAMFGTRGLPLLGERQSGHQRAFVKIQDGCDAHCTYCIIPRLRPAPWSKPLDDAVAEARRLVAAGHREIVLTGIFLGAYGHGTAVRRRQASGAGLGALIDVLCTRVAGLRRLRLSSLEPGDLTATLIETLAAHPQVVPHFHLPLQSGSDAILRRMNRQYTRDEFLRMVERVRAAFDRPALTTDIIVGFPGETDEQFQRTLDVVGSVRFLHIHAFPFSPRPGTAAARWGDDFVPPELVRARIDQLKALSRRHGMEFRRQFMGEQVELLVEGPHDGAASAVQHGRCERYFDVHFESETPLTGRAVRVRINRVTPQRTFGTLENVEEDP